MTLEILVTTLQGMNQAFRLISGYTLLGSPVALTTLAPPSSPSQFLCLSAPHVSTRPPERGEAFPYSSSVRSCPLIFQPLFFPRTSSEASLPAYQSGLTVPATLWLCTSLAGPRVKVAIAVLRVFLSPHSRLFAGGHSPRMT